MYGNQCRGDSRRRIKTFYVLFFLVVQTFAIFTDTKTTAQKSTIKIKIKVKIKKKHETVSLATHTAVSGAQLE